MSETGHRSYKRHRDAGFRAGQRACVALIDREIREVEERFIGSRSPYAGNLLHWMRKLRGQVVKLRPTPCKPYRRKQEATV